MTRALPALFGAALVGSTAVVGLALASWSLVALTAYLVLVAVAAVTVVRRARAAGRHQGSQDGRTCSCCTSTVFDPVEVR
ncbi:MAG TPA: hypothetical protein VMZ11_00485 [Mycobacteriales bacterium]|nr:hypothetical protein [Mycobacteriales bacterium]